MIKGQKEIIHFSDKKVIKIYNRPFTKRIIECFNDDPKTAGQIANSISFPKEKIYYHLKKLVSNDILYVTSTDLVKGIEQKLFLPTAKQFKITKKEITGLAVTKVDTETEISLAPITASEKSLYASIKMSQYIAKKRKLWIQ